VREQSSLSTAYVPVIITIRGDDPTANLVQMAFTLNGADPADGDWRSASWSATPGPLPGDFIAQCLIGPNGGTIALAKGDYSTWAKITANPEVPVIPCGQLTVT
jgi:hypothetical protein